MRYVGSKAKIDRHIIQFMCIDNNKIFVDLFCGGWEFTTVRTM